MAEMTAREQLMLELINRARMDPQAEAARLGVDLSKGQGAPVQVLAGNDAMRAAAYNHSGWMLVNSAFTSFEETGSEDFIAATALGRIKAYGYAVTGRHRYGENISWQGSAEVPDFTATIQAQHDSLFMATASRARLLRAEFEEVGIGQQAGLFVSGGDALTASMVTQDFIVSGAKVFVTGVVYHDVVEANDFYDVGEGIAGRRVSAPGAASDRTGSGGGYELQFDATGIARVTFRLGGSDLKLDVAVGATNVKLDAVNGSEIWTNGSVQSQSAAITALHALGASPLVLIGSGADETITGNRAANQLLGLGGGDVIAGGGGRDTIAGGTGSDTLAGGGSADVFVYTARRDSTPSVPDFIVDFGTGADRLDLSALAGGRLAYRGEGPITGRGQVGLAQDGDNVVVRINLDRDAADEMQIILLTTSITDLAKSDFIL